MFSSYLSLHGEGPGGGGAGEDAADVEGSGFLLRAPAAVLAGRQGGEAEEDESSGDGGAGGHGAGHSGAQGRS